MKTRLENDTIGVYAIDSFKLRIPLDYVQFVGNRLGYEIIEVNAETEELISQEKALKQSYSSDCLETSYSIWRNSLVEKDVRTDFLYITINAKLLKQRYLEGITKENIRLIYDEIISQGVINVPYEVFVNSNVIDLDIKRDHIAYMDEFMKLIEYMRQSAKPNKAVDKGYLLIKRKDNKGIQFSKRDRSSYSNPFLKLYHKTLEMRNNGKTLEFVRQYDVYVPDHLIREEVTIRNAKHFKRFDIRKNTLKSILNLSQSEYHSVFEKAYRKHMNMEKPKKKTTNQLNPKDVSMLNAMQIILETQDYEVDELIDCLVEGMDKQQRYREKKRLWSLYDEHMKPSGDKMAEDHMEFIEQFFDLKMHKN